ncbi:MAG TPA: cyclic nucleotide-binding and patatin-like phospholipase domain-containing protein [Acidimicrobiia bacterium]|nr:cyclic nucleotide-binding and patatin-like phospholipase domain-containing protein [Acidimicrobiia bacterium]
MSLATDRAALPPDELGALLEESAVFAALDADARAFVAARLEAQNAPGGTVLVRQGDAGDCMYLVAIGRFRVTMTRPDGTEALVAEIGRGEVVGELALITTEPRTATVTAVRDGCVLRLSTDAYAELVRRHPDALRSMSTEVVRRLVRSSRGGIRTSPVVTIAVVPLAEDPAVVEFAGRLHASLDRITGQAARHVCRASHPIDELDRAGADRLAAWFAQHEAGFEVALYETDVDPTPWTRACLRQADLILVVGGDGVSTEPRPVEVAIADRRAGLSTRTELVLVHRPSVVEARGTRRWLEGRTVDRHHHVRSDRDGDYDRVARLLLGRGIGAVFSGGGARGLAEIGVYRALLERGVPIDATGGTSIGSIIAGGAARGQTPDQVALTLRRAVVDSSPFDVTFPVVSLAAGVRVSRHLRDAAEGLQLEDLWRNFFCVSTNLSRGDLEVHRTGPAWYAVRASFSIPGVFPPVRSPDGDLLVDGGLVDNLPVDVMRTEHAGITIVSVDVGRTRDLRAGSLPDTGTLSGWRVLFDRLDPRTPSLDTATIGQIMMRLTELGNAGGEDRGDLYIRPPVDAFTIGDFKAFDRLVEIGYQAGIEAVDSWLASEPLSPA